MNEKIRRFYKMHKEDLVKAGFVVGGCIVGYTIGYVRLGGSALKVMESGLKENGVAIVGDKRFVESVVNK